MTQPRRHDARGGFFLPFQWEYDNAGMRHGHECRTGDGTCIAIQLEYVGHELLRAPAGQGVSPTE
jgi:hypothetical protein